MVYPIPCDIKISNMHAQRPTSKATQTAHLILFGWITWKASWVMLLEVRHVFIDCSEHQIAAAGPPVSQPFSEAEKSCNWIKWWIKHCCIRAANRNTHTKKAF